MTKVFIDGSAGTTGLRIHQRLAQRPDQPAKLVIDRPHKDYGAEAS